MHPVRFIRKANIILICCINKPIHAHTNILIQDASSLYFRPLSPLFKEKRDPCRLALVSNRPHPIRMKRTGLWPRLPAEDNPANPFYFGCLREISVFVIPCLACQPIQEIARYRAVAWLPIYYSQPVNIHRPYHRLYADKSLSSRDM